MRDAATLLRELLDVAEAAITRPAIASATLVPTLERELADASPMATDPRGGLLIDDEALLLAQVLRLADKQRRVGDERRAALMQQLAGMLLPAVRAACWRAIEVRRDARPSP